MQKFFLAWGLLASARLILRYSSSKFLIPDISLGLFFRAFTKVVSKVQIKPWIEAFKPLLIGPDISQLFPDFANRVVRSLIICFVHMWILASCHWSLHLPHSMCTGRAYHIKAGGIVRSEPTVLVCLCFRCGLKCVEAGAARGSRKLCRAFQAGLRSSSVVRWLSWVERLSMTFFQASVKA